jgi:diguanylate cyclase (GGDEF)-like protein/PAS domain S-box-containing protein
VEKELRILMVEDVPTDAELEIRELKRAGLRVAHRLVDTEDGFRGALRDFQPNLIISDFSMPHFDGMFALQLARELAPDVPFIFVSGTIGEEYAIRALKNGATDYVLKNNLLRLPASVERAIHDAADRAERRKAEAALQEVTERHRATYENSPIGIMHTDPASDLILHANPKLLEMVGYTADGLQGMSTDGLVHPDHRGIDRGNYRERMLKGELNSFSSERMYVRKDGSTIWVSRTVSLARDAKGKPLSFIRMLEDITERREQEMKIRRLSRIHAVLSGINSAIVRIRDPQQLFDEACRIAVEHGRFGIAWIGRYDPVASEVTPQASAGLEGDYHLMGASLKVGAGSPTASGLIARAVHERRAVYSNDITLEPEKGGQRRQEAIRRGYRSVCALPLLVDGTVAGTLSLFAKETSFFDDEEMKLLTELAGDISFALEHIAGQRKIEKLSRVRAVSSGINAAIVRIRDREGLLKEACRIASEVGKFEMVWIGTLHPEQKDVRPVAWTGFSKETAHAVSWASISSAKGTLGEAMQTCRPSFRNDIETELPAGKLRQEAVQRGCLSTVCLPVGTEGKVTALIVLFAAGRGFFDQDELGLLQEVASNISFALESIGHQEKIERLSRIRNVLGEMNAAIVRIRGKQELFEEACRIAVERGKFGLSWIGLFDPSSKDVTPVAWAGLGSDEIKESKTTARPDVPQGQGLVGEAIRERRPTFSNDISIGPKVGGKRREEAIRLGYRSLMVLPLSAEEAVAGVFALFVKEANFFDEEEITLLKEFAGNISFALESIARQEKIERLSRIRNVLGEMNAAIVRIREKQRLLDEACRIAVEHGKFAMSWIGMVDDVALEIKPVARAGQHEGYLERLKLTLDPNATRHMALAVEALGRSAPVICNDIATDGRMRAWREPALKRGYRSTVMLPLLVEKRGVGILALYASEPGVFDEDEMKLLIELAGDIAFALQTIGQQEKLDYLAYYDPLTGLPNRTLFHDRVNQVLQAQHESDTKAALIFLDLQRFGIVNDTYGRQAGDVVLKQMAERLEKALGGRDYLARVGADTFAAVLRDVKQEADVAHVLEQGILSAVTRPFEIGGGELRMAAQAGIALYPGDGTDAESLFRNADAALGKAKNSGDLYLFYAPQMNARVAEQLRLENDLRNAIAHEQFVLYYQPRFDLANGQILGMEALIRWKHPERGMVSPGEFIPLLEETGMIIDVGGWALRRAAQEHAAWSARGRVPPRIAVNVSPAQLRRRDFVDYVKEALAPVERAAERIDLEITESMLMEDIQGSIEKLKAIQNLGLHIALDDFGTGYSSLSYLARLPINSLKIDRSFIMQMSKSPEQMAIVSTVISLARALNLRVVAEGVETEEQANLLRLLRCDEVQGFLYSRPVSPEDLEGKLRQAGTGKA